MTGVFTEDELIEILEGGIAVKVVGDDSDPVVVAAVGGGPLGKSLEFTGCVSSVIPAVTIAAFPLYWRYRSKLTESDVEEAFLFIRVLTG